MCKHKYAKIGDQTTLHWMYMYIGENLLQSWVHSKAKVYVKKNKKNPNRFTWGHRGFPAVLFPKIAHKFEFILDSFIEAF